MPILHRELEEDVYPNRTEFFVIGIVALVLYTIVTLIAGYGLFRNRSSLAASKSVRDISFFILMLISGLMSIPWAIEYMIQRDVPPFWTYTLKSVSRLSFFAAFCILLNRWAKVLYLKEGAKIFHHNVLIAFNIFLAIVAVIDVTLRRDSYRNDNMKCNATSFSITILTQALFILSILIMWACLGSSILKRLKSWKNVTHQRLDVDLFDKAIENLALILGITMICLSFQFVVLSLNFIGGTTHTVISNYIFTRCGFLWMIFSDFIPQVIPSVTYLLFMQGKAVSKTAVMQRFDISTIITESSSYEQLLHEKNSSISFPSEGHDSDTLNSGSISRSFAPTSAAEVPSFLRELNASDSTTRGSWKKAGSGVH